jgi:uroporphyrinogen-III decarboxylase
MTSRERILCAINGIASDHIPLTTWSFGFRPPNHLRWKSNDNEVKFWYTKRLEHIHTLPRPWTLEDDFKRALAWLSVGIDDILDVSVPWSTDADVTYSDFLIPVGAAGGDQHYQVMVRDYQTAAGTLRHAMKKTGDEAEGWPIQPPCVELFEDYNVPRGIRHLVTEPADVEKAKYLYLPPDTSQIDWFTQRTSKVKEFADKHGVFVQAWAAFGMDAAIWLSGVENATLMSMTDPESFSRLIDNIAETDYARTQLAVMTPGIDMVCQRGWYSSTDFWSPDLFDLYVFPHLAKLTSLAHRYGKKFGYTMSTGVDVLGTRLADAGVDLLYFIDPVMDKITNLKARELFGKRMTMVGGISSVNLNNSDFGKIRREVREAIDVLGPTNRFILHPVDSLFPDTPWRGVETMIEAWKEFR